MLYYHCILQPIEVARRVRLPTARKRLGSNLHMAVKTSALRSSFSLLFGSSLLSFVGPPLYAADQFACQPGATGGWVCSTAAAPQTTSRSHSALTEETAQAGNITRVENSGGRALASRSADYSHLDWVPREELTAAQLAELAPYCSGTYVEPSRPGRFDDTPKGESPIHVSAKATRHDQEQAVSALAGDVVLRQGSLQIEADEARLYQMENRGELAGNVRVRENDLLMVGDRADLSLNNGEATVENVEYVVQSMGIRGGAQYLKREQTAILRLKDGTYTSCDPGSNTWHLHANNITLDTNNGVGAATNVTLRVHDLPVFYTPYLTFPIDDRRKSGFLMPTIGSSGDTGFNILTPYYFNLAPNFDATLYPYYLSSRGMLNEGEFRYLTENSEGSIGGAFLDSDDDDERELQSGYSSKRWMYTWQHRQGLEKRLLAEVDYTDISDPYYFQDLPTNLDVNQSDHLNQQGSLTYRSNSFTARLNLHAYERATVTDITPYDRLPQFTFTGTLPFQPGGVLLDYDLEAVRFERDLRDGNFVNEDGESEEWYDNRLKGLARAEGNRFHFNPGISLPLNWTSGYVKPSLKYAYTYYDLDLDQEGRNTLGYILDDQVFSETFDENPDRSIPIFSVDAGLYFDRETTLFGSHSRQTLEPRLFYLYVGKDDQEDIPIFDTGEYDFSYSSLWRENRFSGNDRIGDANQLALGVTSRWLDDDGLERQRFSLGQIIYFRDREVQLRGIDYEERERATSSLSPIALEYMYRHNRDWHVNADWNWDPDVGQLRSTSAVFHYQPEDEPRKIINLGYRYRSNAMRFDQASGTWQYDDDYGSEGTAEYIKDYYKIQQHDFSSIWPINPQWSAIGRWQYDYNRSRTLEAFAGFEYDSCCWKLRLISRYWLDYDEASLDPDQNDDGDTGLFLQITLKGMGNVIGGATDTLLDQSIEGYRRREEESH